MKKTVIGRLRLLKRETTDRDIHAASEIPPNAIFRDLGTDGVAQSRDEAVNAGCLDTLQ